MVDHGISEAALKTIRTVLATCSDEITQVDLFGSRAVGRHRRNSDIDLVVLRLRSGLQLRGPGQWAPVRLPASAGDRSRCAVCARR